jgi:shikimate dehydrogenase
VATGPVIQLAVFGNPVGQSLSPEIHRNFAEQCGLNVDYQAIEASTESFPEQVRTLAGRGGRGCNITAPFKKDAWRLAGDCSETARRAQACNTLLFESDSNWFADSTDGPGLVNDLQSIVTLPLESSRICLIGAGGAAASILATLLGTQPKIIVVANRSIDRAKQLAQLHDDLGTIHVSTPQALQKEDPFDLVINATSLGHGGQAPGLLADWLNPGALCYDMNYGPAAAPLREQCLGQGIRYSDGLGMLVGQAALSFRLWTGKTPDTAQTLRYLRRTPG